MARRPLRVAFLTSARGWRGSGVSFSHIASALIGRGHRVHMLAGEASVVAEFDHRGFPVTLVSTGRTGVKGARALARSLRTVQADCLIVDRPRDLRLGALAALVHPVALINRYNLSRGNPPRDLLSRLAYLAVRFTVFVSETNARQALSRARYLRRRPHQVIPEGVDPAFHPDQERGRAFCARYGLVDGRFVLAVGSLTADKRYEFLFDIMVRLGADAPLLVVCGIGPLARSLQDRAAALGIKVRFLGHVGPELLPGAYTAAMLFLHACEIETFGLSVLESMACGRPVVAVDGGAVPEVLGAAGILVPVNDPDAYASSVRQLLSDPRLRESLAVAAQQRARKFSLQQMQQSYVEVIERVSGRVQPTSSDP